MHTCNTHAPWCMHVYGVGRKGERREWGRGETGYVALAGLDLAV